MQRRKGQVACFSNAQCHLDRLEITHFADQHDVGILSKCSSESRAKRMRIGRNLTLIYNAILMIMQKLDRVLDRQNMIVTLDIDLIDHRCKRRRFTRTGWPGHEDEAAWFLAHVGNHGGQAESVERLDLIRNGTKHRSDRTFLVKKIGTKTRHTLEAEREIEFEVFLKPVLLRICQHGVCQPFCIRWRHRGQPRQRCQMAVNTDLRRRIGGKVEIRSTKIGHLFEEVGQRDRRFV